MDEPKYVQLIISDSQYRMAVEVARTKGFKSVRAWAKFLLERAIKEGVDGRASAGGNLEAKRN